MKCIYCGAETSITRDHVPPKSLMRKPYPTELLTVPACRACNYDFSRDEEYFRLVVVGLLCHTDEADQVFDGAISRSMDRRPGNEEKMFGSILAVDGKVSLDVEYDRISRVAEKIARGLEFVESGCLFRTKQRFIVNFEEVDEIRGDARYSPDFTFQRLLDSPGGWEFTLYGSVRFSVWLA